ncbi:MAG: 4Fe-4S binding protein [Pseudomonadota bacterium]
MKIRGKQVLACNCEATMPLDETKLTEACHATGAEGPLALNSQLCRAQLGNFQQAVAGGQPLLIACTQEAPLFSEVAAEQESETELAFVNVRETAGWSDQADGPDGTAKIAALIAEAAEAVEPTPSVELASEGQCLVYGRDELAIEAAKQLTNHLEVTVLLTEPGEILPPGLMDVPIFKGTIERAEGRLGHFAVNVRGYAPASPSSRQALAFEAPRDNAYTECHLILDLSGGQPLFPAHQRRDGYLRPDPDNPAAVQHALFKLADMVGEYEKPRYVRYDPEICAHARSRKTGCTRCLDVCPVSAITPDGDHVAIDPYICGGCGACASVCPTGAATYQMPAGDSLLQRLRRLLGAYLAAGGSQPVLLLHDGGHGNDMIGLIARSGRGLPGQVLPFALNQVTQVGLDFLASAFAYGAAGIGILVGPDKADELAGLAGQIGLAETVMAGLGYEAGRIAVLDQLDPEAVERALWDWAPPPAPAPGNFLPMGGKRTRTLLALRRLHDTAPAPVETLALPAGAPFGAIEIDAKGCTLCLACVGACPTGALLDDETRPWLGFNEEACVQCGLCRSTCPESVMTLVPRLSFAEDARGAVTLNEEPPFHCIRCGQPFGVQRSIERIADQLAGKHYMFSSSAQVELIAMCQDCRIIVEFEKPDLPLAGAPRPRIRTTDDDLREREIEEARAKLLAERAAEADKKSH